MPPPRGDIPGPDAPKWPGDHGSTVRAQRPDFEGIAVETASTEKKPPGTDVPDAEPVVRPHFESSLVGAERLHVDPTDVVKARDQPPAPDVPELGAAVVSVRCENVTAGWTHDHVDRSAGDELD